MAERQVKIGVRPKDLEQKGVRYEGGGFMPQVPDYLGYVLGLALVWLVYTGYQTAVETVREPIAKITEKAEVIKEKVEVIAESAQQSEPLPLPESVVKPSVNEPSEGWWFRQLERLNNLISWAADYVSLQLHDMFPSEEDELDTSPLERRPPQENNSSTNF